MRASGRDWCVWQVNAKRQTPSSPDNDSSYPSKRHRGQSDGATLVETMLH